jgi:hypothetical protein
MEQVFFQFHQRSVNTVTTLFSDRSRRVLEWTILAVSVAALALLGALHNTHVARSDGGCLQQLVPEYELGSMPEQLILQVTLLPPPSTEVPAGLRQLFFGVNASKGPTSPADRSSPVGWYAQLAEESVRPLWALLPALEPVSYSFSFDKGLLLLGDDLLERYNVEVRRVTVTTDDACLGGHPLLRGVLQSALGFDTVVNNWFVALGGGKGYVRVGPAPVSRVVSPGTSAVEPPLTDLHRAAELVAAADSRRAGDMGVLVAFKCGVALTTLFLFFITTTLVAFTLRETQERMLKFTFLLHHHVTHNMSYGPLILTHMVDSLVYLPIMVGTLFFLFEFFGHDKLLAFVVLCIVWCSEVYSVVAVRTPTSIRFYPRFFLLYFVFFHVYFFSFPFGFTILALVASVGLQVHAMLHFWSRFEVLLSKALLLL